MRKQRLDITGVLLPIMIVFLLLPTTAFSIDLPFHNPPESSTDFYHVWVTEYPYQRNIMIDFDKAISGWNPDANFPDKLELSPGQETCIWCGWDDAILYEPDWISFDANFENYWFSSLDVAGSPVGFIGTLNSPDHRIVRVYIHLNNDPIPYPTKHVYGEIDTYFSAVDFNLWAGYGYGTDPGQSEWSDWFEILPDSLGPFYHGRHHFWITMAPNPAESGETLSFDVATFGNRTLLIDKIHIATEAVALLGDVNLDGALDAGDITRLFNYLLGKDLRPVHCADVNNDCEVTPYDLSYLFNSLLGKVPLPGICSPDIPCKPNESE